MSEEREKKIKRASQLFAKAASNLVLQQLLLAEERRERGEPLEAAPRKRKTAGAASAENDEAPAPAAAAAPKKKKAAKATAAPAASVADDAEWKCDGNIITGEAHEGDSIAHTTRAPNTKHNGKLYTSCKACKKAIKKSK